MFDNVIVGAGPEDGGRDAFALAARLAGPRATIVVVRVFDPVVLRTRPEPPAFAAGPREVRAVTVEGAVVGPHLHALARETGADLIVVGSSARGPFERLVFGDDTRETVRDAPCAVAVAPHGFAEHDRAVERVGAGWHGTPASQAALDVARGLARRAGGRPELLSIVPGGTALTAPGTYPHISLTSEVERVRAQLAELDDITGVALVGDPVEELAHLSRRVDVLVVGASAPGALGRLLGGSVPEQLARHLHGPLLVVPVLDAPAPAARSGATARSTDA